MSTAIEQLDIIKFRISKNIYEKEAILAAGYSLSCFCSSIIEPGQDGYFYVSLELLPEQNSLDLNKIKQSFLNELTDQQLRLDLEKRYDVIRELIVKQAFSPLEHLETEVIKLVGRG